MEIWQPTLQLRLHVTVVLLGLNDEGPSDDDGLVVQSESLARTLQGVLSSYYAPVVPAVSSSRGVGAGARQQPRHQHGGISSSAFQVRYDISYAVRHASTESHNAYLEALANAAEVDTTGEEGAYRPLRVPIDAISQAVEKIALTEADVLPLPVEPAFGDTEVAILVANPSRAGLRAQLDNRGKRNPAIEVAHTGARREAEYRFAEPGSLHRVKQESGVSLERGNDGDAKEQPSTCASSWIGQGRVLVLDLGAVACGYGALRDFDPHATVTEDMFPSGTVRSNAIDRYWLHTREQVHDEVAGESTCV